MVEPTLHIRPGVPFRCLDALSQQFVTQFAFFVYEHSPNPPNDPLGPNDQHPPPHPSTLLLHNLPPNRNVNPPLGDSGAGPTSARHLSVPQFVDSGSSSPYDPTLSIHTDLGPRKRNCFPSNLGIQQG